MRNLIVKYLYAFLVRNFLRWIIGVDIKVARNLDVNEQFILVANHNSHMDTLALMASLPARMIPRVKPVAACDYFGKTKFKAFFSTFFLNTLLIHRKKDKQENPIEKMQEILDQGYSLITFP